MATTAKALAKMRELKDTLTKFLVTPMPVATDSFDSDGNPVLTLSADATPAANEKVCVIRIKPIAWALAKDIVGNAAIQYSHHVIQICTEEDTTVTPAELTPILVECGRRGSFVEWYQSDDGTVPSVDEMTDANLMGTWKDLYFNILKAD